MNVKIEVTEEQLKVFAKLAYLGNYVISSCRTDDEEEADMCDELCNSLYCKIYCHNFSGTPADIEDNEIADIRDRICDSAEFYLHRFENDILSRNNI